jgi:hypothetical protein
MESITDAATATIEFIESNKSLINTAAKLALVLGTAGAGFMALSGVVKIATGSLWMAQKAYAGLMAGIAASKAVYAATAAAIFAVQKSLLIATTTSKLFVVSLQALHSGLLSMEQISQITPVLENFKALLTGIPAVLGQIALAVGVAIAAFKLGEAIAEWTGLDEKIKDAYFWLFNIKELNRSEVESKMISTWRKQLKDGIIDAKEFERRLSAIKSPKKKTVVAELSDAKNPSKPNSTTAQEKDDSRAWRNAELRLDLMYEGYELEKKKLSVSRDEALAGAEGQQKIIDLIHEEYQLRLDLLNMRTGKSQAEEDARRMLQLEERKKEIADIDGYQKNTNEALLLDLQYDGYGLSKKKLELEKRIAFERAKAEGANIDLVEKEYQLRNQILEAENARSEAELIAQNTRESSGTFSSSNLNQSLGIYTSTFDRIAKASEETAKNTKMLKNMTESTFAS